MIHLKEFKITVLGLEEAKYPRCHAYDVIINVDDAPDENYFVHDDGIIKYWYPINEMSNWGYGPFYWSKKILDYHVAKGDRILLHCAGGVCRSPSVLVCWLKSRSLRLPQEDGSASWFEKQVQRMMDLENRIPRDLLKFYHLMDKNPTYSLMGVLGLMEEKGCLSKRMNH